MGSAWLCVFVRARAFDAGPLCVWLACRVRGLRAVSVCVSVCVFESHLSLRRGAQVAN